MGATSNLTQVKPKCNDVDNRQSENVDFPLASSLRVEKYYNPLNIEVEFVSLMILRQYLNNVYPSSPKICRKL